MLVWTLRGILLGEAALLGWFFPALAGDFGPGAAIVFLLVAFVAFQAAQIGLAYGVAALHASPRPAGVEPPGLLDAATEIAAFLALFVVIQPFERLWMGPDTVGRLAPGRRPVLLVHGYFCNRGFWWWIRRGLRVRGFAVATVDLESPISDIEILADGLDARIDALLAETGADAVLLVTHSMGGLVARALLRKTDPARVARFVTLGGPHHGTRLAFAGLGRNARQMEPENPWLVDLNDDETPPVPTLSIWSRGDQLVVPQATSHLAGTREVVVPTLGHVAMAFSPTVLDLIAADLAEGTASITGADRA